MKLAHALPRTRGKPCGICQPSGSGTVELWQPCQRRLVSFLPPGMRGKNGGHDFKVLRKHRAGITMLIREQISGSAVSKSDTMRWRSFLPAHSCDFESDSRRWSTLGLQLYEKNVAFDKRNQKWTMSQVWKYPFLQFLIWVFGEDSLFALWSYWKQYPMKGTVIFHDKQFPVIENAHCWNQFM